MYELLRSCGIHFQMSGICSSVAGNQACSDDTPHLEGAAPSRESRFEHRWVYPESRRELEDATMNSQLSDMVISGGISRSHGVARVARGKIMLRVAAVLCGSLLVLGVAAAAGAGIALSLPLSILVPGKLAAISPHLLATWLGSP
jgi:hypothetical protein